MRFTMYSRFNTMAAEIGIEATADFAVKMGFSSVEILESTAPVAPSLIPDTKTAAYAKEICHVHIKDYLRKSAPVSPGRYWLPAQGGKWLRDTMVGSGVIDFAACMKILRDVGYSGTLALELDHPEPFEEGVRQAMDYLRRFES